jgi:hypothetical protein
MDEYIRADNDFCQRSEEVQRYTKMTRASKGGFIQETSELYTTQAKTKKKLFNLKVNHISAKN